MLALKLSNASTCRACSCVFTLALTCFCLHLPAQRAGDRKGSQRGYAISGRVNAGILDTERGQRDGGRRGRVRADDAADVGRKNGGPEEREADLAQDTFLTL